jgi:hypothetical protein
LDQDLVRMEKKTDTPWSGGTRSLKLPEITLPKPVTSVRHVLEAFQPGSGAPGFIGGIL